MIGITKLFYGKVEPSDLLRYGGDEEVPPNLLQFKKEKKPIVVWNITRRCNLKCVHCYSDSEDREYEDELSHEEAISLISDLAEYKVPVLLFSGGEPLMRRDIFDLMERAKGLGLRIVLSSNGTMIKKDVAERLKGVGLDYAGISLDGTGEVNDRFRGVSGAFDRAMEGIRNLKSFGVKVGVRFTITKRNLEEIDGLFRIVEEESLDRLCFYHLVFTGRGREMKEDLLHPSETRMVVDRILQKTGELVDKGLPIEVLTVDNHTDGVYIYLKLRKIDPERGERVRRLLEWNGGNNSGIAIACIDNRGDIHPDQFWLHESVGNVRERRFSEVWSSDHPLLHALRHRKELLKGRCARCSFLDICNGNFRVRAFHLTGDLWQEDPACYLNEDEIR